VGREAVSRRFREAAVRKDYLEFDKEFYDLSGLWGLYLGPKERFATVLKDVPEVTDDKPWIEYPYFRSKSAEYFRAPRVLRWDPAPVPFT
jgi:hypothetical protein